MRPDRSHTADDFMAGYAGILRAFPLRAHLVQVGMADAAERDINLDIVSAWRAASNTQWLQRLVAGVCTVSIDKHDSTLLQVVRAILPVDMRQAVV